MDDSQQQDICRVCRSEATPDKPLYHPCICTGSIKYIHQECLVQWLKYSRKEYCELCNHRFAFMPIYSPDMPKRLPVKDLFSGLLSSLGTAVRYWLHYTLVAFAWLGVVPLTACRIYRSLFTGSVSSLLTLPLDMMSTDNLLSDSFYGCCVVTCTLCAFISLVWLREQILHGGGPDWLDQDLEAQQENERERAAGLPMAENNNEVPVNQPEGEAQAAADGAQVFDAAGNAGNDGVNNAAAQADDVNWNPIEWDRAEELTWERLLGLDGSLLFLEHVFWVISLNTLFILLFAFCPYHIGHFTVIVFSLTDYVAASQFEGLLTTLCGYVVIGVVLVFLHALASVARLPKARRLLGLCYVVVKVSLLSVFEIGVFPLVCGWWLDICSLTMLDSSLEDREASFKLAPGTSMFIHWLVGMVYVFYFASFILLLREVLRPGVLWFLRNLNDPEFNPIQEMIHLPILRHIRRFCASLVIFGTTVMLMVWFPVCIVQKFLPGFLPYSVILSNETPVTELSLELLLLQVVLPGLLEQGHTRQWLKALVRTWCRAVSYVLDLRSYLLGDEPLEEEDEPEMHGVREEHVHLNEDVPAAANVQGPAPVQQQPPPPVAAAAAPAAPAPAPVPAQEGGGFQPPALAAAHQALMLGGGPTIFQPYRRPSFFALRILLLLVLTCFSLMIGSLVMLTFPVFIGRKLMGVWMGGVKVHELYTAACGLYVCWFAIRFLTLLCSWLPKGWGAIMVKVNEWILITSKTVVAVGIVLGMIPLLMGLLFDVVIIVPLRVPINQTPILYIWQDWALGVLHTKIICALTLMGPNWWLKRGIEQVYHDGLRNINLRFLFVEFAGPVIVTLGLVLAIPYVAACGIVPLFNLGHETENAVFRRIYPSLLASFVLSAIVVFQVRQFRRFYEHIKNDKYLVGRRLVNYEHRQAAASLAQHSSHENAS